MFIYGDSDVRTLAQIRKSIPAERLDEAEAEGIFDLLKAGNLHPQKVLVHGKHGPYYATRMVSSGAAGSSEGMPKPQADPEESKEISAQEDIKRYAGRLLKDIYAEEGERGVMRALGAQYAEDGIKSHRAQTDRLEEFYGHSDTYTPEAAARAMQIWTSGKLRLPEIEGMDADELEDWYNEEGYKHHSDEDGMVWACSMIRGAANQSKIDFNSESGVTAFVCGKILKDVFQQKSRISNSDMYRGVVMPEGTIEEILHDGKADLGGITSFTSSQAVALGFIRDSPVWSYEDSEGTIPEQIVFVVDGSEKMPSYMVRQSKYSESEEIVVQDKPLQVSKVCLDDVDGPDLFEEEPEDYDPLEDHVYYVYLKGNSNG